MNRSEIIASWLLPFTILATALALIGCGKMASQYEADYNYQVLKKSPDGTVSVVEKGTVERAIAGDGGGGEIPGVGRVATRVHRISTNTATIEITLPRGAAVKLDLPPKETIERFPEGSDYGVRITLDQVRTR